MGEQKLQTGDHLSVSPQLELGEHDVLCQKWEESERGWGTRPDGVSLHLSLSQLEEFIDQYWDGMPDSVPSTYSRPDGEPYPLGVSRITFAAIVASRNGIRLYEPHAPGSGGMDGWLFDS